MVVMGVLDKPIRRLALGGALKTHTLCLRLLIRGLSRFFSSELSSGDSGWIGRWLAWWATLDFWAYIAAQKPT